MGVKVRERPKNSGIWWIFIDHQGKRKAKKIGHDKALANKIAKTIEAKLVLEEKCVFQEKPTIPSIKEIGLLWLESQVRISNRKTTYNRYKGLLKTYILPTIGSIKIDQLKRRHVLSVLQKMMNKKLSRSSVEQAKNVISGISEYAIDNEYITSNPTSGVMKRLGLKKKPAPNSIIIFRKAEISHLLDTCRTYRPDYYPLILTAFRTGLRLGEILALRWENINWHTKYVEVKNSWRNGTLSATKTGTCRCVDLSDQLIGELSRLLKQRKKEALKSGTNEIESIIFHTKEGEYISQNTVRNIWRRLLSKAGFEYRKFHCTRHTFASLLIANNFPLNYVKEMLGHHSIQMTVDTYGHLIPHESKSAVNFLDDTTIRNPSATTENKTLVTNEDHEGFSNLVAMQGLEPRTLRI